jgi:hypothetical protein
MSTNTIKSRLKNLLFKLCQSELAKIQRYKDIHKDESCYIIGDGISLKWFDLEEFSNKISISLGLIPFHKQFKALNVKYLMLVEPYWFYPAFCGDINNSRYMRHISKAYRGIIQDNQDKQFFLNFSNYPVLRSKNLTYLFHDIPDERLPENFITRRLYAFEGSLRSSILLAIYMGFDHCYLVGCDYTHVPSRTFHWYEKGMGMYYPIKDYHKEFFEVAKEFIDITTVTLDGTSDFINAVTYKEHTGCEPIYRENTALVDEQYQKVLATWHGYKIY